MKLIIEDSRPWGSPERLSYTQGFLLAFFLLIPSLYLLGNIGYTAGFLGFHGFLKIQLNEENRILRKLFN